MWWRVLRERGEFVALAALLVSTVLLPGPVPPAGIYALGLSAGGTLALHALGLVLVYRSNRIINFAQIELGLASAVLTTQLVARRQFLVWLHPICPSCLPDGTGRVTGAAGVDPSELSSAQRAAYAADGWLVTANYVLAVLLGLLLAAGLAYAVYHLVIKRFANAPRLVLTVLTIALVRALQGVRGQALQWATPEGQEPFTGAIGLPFEAQFRIGPTVLEAPDVLRLAIAAAAVVGLVVFFRRSAVGVALRGVADNPSRAETLGVPVARVTGRVWVFAGLLSATVALLDAAAVGSSGATSASSLVRVLAAAVFAAFISLPVTVLAAAVIGVVDQAVLWGLDSALITDALLLVVIVGVLLLQRARVSRADTEAPSWAAAREVRPVPAELRDLAPVAAWRRRGAIALAVVFLGMPWLLSPSQTSTMAATVAGAIVALSLLVLTGWAGQISLGQMGLAAAGAWTAAVLDWPFPFGMLAGALTGAAVAALLGLPALRLRGQHLAVVTLAFAVAVPAVLLNPRYLARRLPSTVDRPILLGLDLSDPRTFYYVALAFLVVAVVAVMGMRRSRTIRALIACRDNEAAAQAFGINLLRARLGAFAIAGFMAATGGVLISWAEASVDGQTFGADASVQVFLVAVLGGVGSVAGPLIGAFWIGTLGLLGGAGNQLASTLATGLGTVAVLMFLPGGIGQGVQQARDGYLRRVADRYRIDVPSLTADRATSSHDRAGILPPSRGGARSYVPRRYRLERNWVVPSVDDAERVEAGADR